MLEVVARTQVNECSKLKLCCSATSICVHTASSDCYFDFLLMMLEKTTGYPAEIWFSQAV